MLKANSTFGRFRLRNAEVRADFYEDLAVALGDGVDIVSYLRKRQLRAPRLRDPLGAVYGLWLRRMESSFAQAIRSDIPEAEYVALSAAEAGASLPENLRFLAKTLREVAAMKRALLGALVTPLVVCCGIVLMLYGFAQKFVPLIASVVPPEKWPASGQMLYGLAGGLEAYGATLLLMICALAAVFLWSIHGYTQPFRRVLDNYPPYSLLRAYNGALALVALAVFMGAGTSLVESLRHAARNTGGWTRWRLNAVLHRLDLFSAEPGTAFDVGLLPPRTLLRVADRAERSDFGEALRAIGAQVVGELHREVLEKARLLNALLLVGAGIVLGGLVYGFLDTMYSIQGTLRQSMM